MKLVSFDRKYISELNKLRNDKELQILLGADDFKVESEAKTLRWVQNQVKSKGFKIVLNNEIFCGFIKFYKFKEIENLKIYCVGIALSKSTKGKGIGTKVMNEVSKNVPKNSIVFTEIMTKNLASQKLFKKVEFLEFNNEKLLKNFLNTRGKYWSIWSKNF
jgi:ribosomal protein S18 acetylase RimI-like enzyme